MLPGRARRLPAFDLKLPPRRAAAAALLAGAVGPFAFAPFGLFPLAAVVLALLFGLWQHARPGAAAWHGFLFGIGFFGVGVSWVYVSLHGFGGMPAPLAAAMVVLFVAYLAGFPALAGALQALLPPGAPRLLLAMPAVWLGTEWLRGTLFTGFPWLDLGFSQVTGPLAGFAPVGGVYLVSLAIGVSSALLLAALQGPRRGAHGVALIALWAIGAALKTVAWTAPQGPPIPVALVQADVPVEIKWVPAYRDRIIARYLRMSDSAPAARIVVWPETAAPDYLDALGDLRARLRAEARERGVTYLFGVIETVPGPTQSRVYNSLVALGPDGVSIYRKRHLVPFGEYLPLRPWLGWLLDYLHIPMADFSAWPGAQPPLTGGGQRLGATVCYEDAFGDAQRRSIAHSSLLVNVSEDAWFGESLAPHQHLEISRMLALASGRDLMRATNTGISALIDARGRVLARSPEFAPDVLTGRVQPRTGLTPYVRVGDAPALALATLAFALAIVFARVKK